MGQGTAVLLAFANIDASRDANADAIAAGTTTIAVKTSE